MTGRKVISVMRLPQIDPPFAEDQRWRDGCMNAAHHLAAAQSGRRRWWITTRRT
jgi:hypothetical protein